MVNVPLLLEPVERAVKVSGAPAQPLGHVLYRDLPEILRQRLHEIELNYSISNRLFMNGTDRVPTHHRVDVVIGAQDQRRLLLFRAILVFPVHPEARSPHQTFSRLHPVVVHPGLQRDAGRPLGGDRARQEGRETEHALVLWSGQHGQDESG